MPHLLQFLRVQRARFAELVRTRPPPIVIPIYVATLASRIARRARISGEENALVRDLDREGTYSTRWFDGNAIEWMRIFRAQRLQDKPIRVLEIGSWEGRSTVFMLHHLPMAEVTAVDTWQGGREHAGDPRLERVEELFDANVARYGVRLTKVKSTSAEFFRSYRPSTPFDLVYVDGSHHADDVMVDAMGGFDLLASGGIIIFDDYLWDRRTDTRLKPAVAINRFLRMKRGSYRILSVTTQIILKKIA
jgi:predicted O-methyltransferase YrrM